MVLEPRTKAPRTGEQLQTILHTKTGYVGYDTDLPEGPNFIKKEDSTRIGFSEIPAEVRNIIYKYALRTSDGEAIPFRRYPAIGTVKPIAFNLLNTCSAVWEEAKGTFHSQNSFRVDVLHVTSDMLPREQQVEHLMKHKKLSFREAMDEESKHCEEWSTAHLSRTLESIPAEDLALIKTFVFAQHFAKATSGRSVDSLDLDRTPECIWEVKLLGKKPYFELRYRYAFGAEGFVTENTHKWNGVNVTIGVRRLRALAKRDVVELAQTFLPCTD